MNLFQGRDGARLQICSHVTTWPLKLNARIVVVFIKQSAILLSDYIDQLSYPTDSPIFNLWPSAYFSIDWF